jgi:hypothetical protein
MYAYVVLQLLVRTYLYRRRDSSVGIATSLKLDDLDSIPGKVTDFSVIHNVQNGSGNHPASYPMGTWGSVSGDKAAGAWSWPLTSI